MRELPHSTSESAGSSTPDFPTPQATICNMELQHCHLHGLLSGICSLLAHLGLVVSALQAYHYILPNLLYIAYMCDLSPTASHWSSAGRANTTSKIAIHHKPTWHPCATMRNYLADPIPYAQFPPTWSDRLPFCAFEVALAVTQQLPLERLAPDLVRPRQNQRPPLPLYQYWAPWSFCN
eukprot:TRINITY_DN77984_c0_g1_i1.p1 TRINITY_DN77984_c0_g1~~TRINITY_DN77984_c0_g1_i1.p1  ORF type:complete len:179 (+),score=8.92 TRINITY_DN77984_c0_g1_i1:709-1245(+)